MLGGLGARQAFGNKGKACMRPHNGLERKVKVGFVVHVDRCMPANCCHLRNPDRGAFQDVRSCSRIPFGF
eukprot:365249-Chlamydomonas_euryale.AAC.13